MHAVVNPFLAGTVDYARLAPSDAIEETRKRAFRRRAFKYVILPGSYVEEIEDEDECREEMRRLWKDFEETLQRIGR